MCRLFGFRSNVPSRAHRSLVEAENALSRQAEQHADGWGIGYFLGDDAYILKSEVGAAEDDRFDRITSRLQSETFLVHVRRATVGQKDHLNSHPFRYGAWMFAHNGTLFGFDKLKAKVKSETEPELLNLIFGSTDSEHLFYYLLSALHRAGIGIDGHQEVDLDQVADVLSAAVTQIYQWSVEFDVDPPVVNYILTNGRVFLAQRAGLDLYLASQKVTCADFATCTEPNKVCMDVVRPVRSLCGETAGRKVNHLLVASERIGVEDLWEEIPQGWMVVLDENFKLTMKGPVDGFREPRLPFPEPNLSAQAN